MDPSPDDILEIQSLLARYAHGWDAGDPDAWAETFTVDGEFTGPYGTYRGRDALSRFCRSLTVEHDAFHTLWKQHWANNVVVDVDGDDATGQAMFVMVQRTPEGPGVLTMVGASHDRYRRVDGRWHFAARTVSDVGAVSETRVSGGANPR